MSGTVATAPSAQYSGAGLSDAEKVDVRRFCGYQAYGLGAVGFQSWRFEQSYGELEFRMNNYSIPEFQVVRSYLATLYTLEQAITAAGGTLNVESATGFERNPNELRERNDLYDSWRKRLCYFMGVPLGDELANGVNSNERQVIP